MSYTDDLRRQVFVTLQLRKQKLINKQMEILQTVIGNSQRNTALTLIEPMCCFLFNY